jgi:hypothetical protein
LGVGVISDFGFGVSVFGFRFFRFWASDFGLRVSGLRFQLLSFGSRRFGFLVSGVGFAEEWGDILNPGQKACPRLASLSTLLLPIPRVCASREREREREIKRDKEREREREDREQ